MDRDGINQMLKKARKRAAVVSVPDDRDAEPVEESAVTIFRPIEAQRYPMSRKERRRRAREARKNGFKDVSFRYLWGEMVREGAYVETP